MSNGGVFGAPRGQTERSTAGIPEDVKKPLLIAVLSGPVIAAGFGLVYLVIWLNWHDADPWACRRFFETQRPKLLSAPLVFWALTFFALFAVWLVENWNKHWPPAYGPADPAMGLLGPLGGILRSWKSLFARQDSMQEKYERMWGVEDRLQAMIENVVRDMKDEEP